jgi:hypothetical protein
VLAAVDKACVSVVNEAVTAHGVFNESRLLSAKTVPPGSLFAAFSLDCDKIRLQFVQNLFID